MDVLDRKMMMDSLMSRARQSLIPSQAGRGAVPVQPGAYGNPIMQTGGPGDETAFNERNKNRALFGDRWNKNGGIGRPGLMSERTSAEAMSNTLKNKVF